MHLDSLIWVALVDENKLLSLYWNVLKNPRIGIENRILND